MSDQLLVNPTLLIKNDVGFVICNLSALLL